jgi:hypothetical protein
VIARSTIAINGITAMARPITTPATAPLKIGSDSDSIFGKLWSKAIPIWERDLDARIWIRFREVNQLEALSGLSSRVVLRIRLLGGFSVPNGIDGESIAVFR